MATNPEIRRLARELMRAVGNEDQLSGPIFRFSEDSATFADHDTLAKLAAAFLRVRRLRADVLPVELFGEAAWDLLLDLYVHKRRGRRVSVTSACIASGVPSTTALRWIADLVDRGLVEREEDSRDRRRALLRLSDQGESQVAQALVAAHDNLRRVFAPLAEPAPAR